MAFGFEALECKKTLARASERRLLFVTAKASGQVSEPEQAPGLGVTMNAFL